MSQLLLQLKALARAYTVSGDMVTKHLAHN